MTDHVRQEQDTERKLVDDLEEQIELLCDVSGLEHGKIASALEQCWRRYRQSGGWSEKRRGFQEERRRHGRDR